MSPRRHRYVIELNWVGNGDPDPGAFRNHARAYQITSGDKPPIHGSSDATFRGDESRWNPEELLVASLSACHQLWYLGLCAAAGIVVKSYRDAAEGTMLEETPGGAGQFTEVTLRPHVTLARGASQETAQSLHHTAHERCFIARSVNFPVLVLPVVVVE
ncbi:MAG: OsmC family protein [Burkholderiaceae bacterium]|jgi:organic hydroperoxide reductase OsmC/OhrA